MARLHVRALRTRLDPRRRHLAKDHLYRHPHRPVYRALHHYRPERGVLVSAGGGVLQEFFYLGGDHEYVPAPLHFKGIDHQGV